MDNHLNRLLYFFFFDIMILTSMSFISCHTDDDYEQTKNETETNNNKDDDLPSDDTIEGPNLLKNGGMEKWKCFSYDILDGWLCHNNINVKREYKIVFEGSYSAKMQSKESGSTATVDQSVPVVPGSKIRIRFHYYVKQWKTNGARTYCYFRTGAAEVSTIPTSELKEFYDKNTYYIIRGGGYGLTYLPHDLNVWKVFDETIVVPPNATYFVFGVNSYYGTTIIVDDCYVINYETD